MTIRLDGDGYVGVDIMHDQASVWLVLTVWGDMTIRLDGDGYVGVDIMTRSALGLC